MVLHGLRALPDVVLDAAGFCLPRQRSFSALRTGGNSRVLGGVDI